MPDPAALEQIIAPHLGREGPLLPILHDIQAAFGHIPDAALPVLSEVLNLTRAEVHGVVSFYHDFRAVPAGRHVLKLCRAEACQAMGGPDAVLAALGAGFGETTAQGLTIEPVYCLGLCACAPAAMLDGQVIGRATPSRVQAALREVAP